MLIYTKTKSKPCRVYDAYNNCYLKEDNNLSIFFSKGIINKSMFEEISCRNDIDNITIYLDSTDKFNKVCKQFNSYTSKPLNIMFYHINAENQMDEVANLQYNDEITNLDIDRLPDNITITYKKINDYSIDKRSIDMDNTNSLCLNCWLLHLSNTMFEKFVSKLDEKSKKYVMLEKQIVKKTYTLLKRKYPNIDDMSSVDKINIVSEYIKNNIMYEDIDELSSDPISTFIRKKGNSYGRAQLLQILTNNKYLNVRCYCVKDKDENYWNEIVENDNNIFEIDLSDSDVSAQNMEDLMMLRMNVVHSSYINKQLQN